MFSHHFELQHIPTNRCICGREVDEIADGSNLVALPPVFP